MAFNKLLEESRNKVGIAPEEAAGIIGVTVATYNKYEAGTVMPKLENIIKLADAYNVSLDYLFGREKFFTDYINDIVAKALEATCTTCADRRTNEEINNESTAIDEVAVSVEEESTDCVENEQCDEDIGCSPVACGDYTGCSAYAEGDYDITEDVEVAETATDCDGCTCDCCDCDKTNEIADGRSEARKKFDELTRMDMETAYALATLCRILPSENVDLSDDFIIEVPGVDEELNGLLVDNTYALRIGDHFFFVPTDIILETDIFDNVVNGAYINIHAPVNNYRGLLAEFPAEFEKDYRLKKKFWLFR